jgi:hypothetical protein
MQDELSVTKPVTPARVEAVGLSLIVKPTLRVTVWAALLHRDVGFANDAGVFVDLTSHIGAELGPAHADRK